MTFHTKTCCNGFPFSNGIPFRTRLKEICIHSNDLGHPFKKIFIRSNGLITRLIETSSRSNDLLTRLVKASIRSNDLLTRSIKTSNRSNDLLTRLLKTSNRLNDLLTRSLEHPSVQTTWVWDSHTSGCLFLFAYLRVLHDVTYGKKPSDHLNSQNRCGSKLQMKTTIL